MKARTVYDGSSGALTARYMRELRARGPLGQVAALLFKAQKASKRAKRYGPFSGRGGRSFQDMSYERKGDALRELSAMLAREGARLGVVSGWGEDRSSLHPFVFYVELPGFGQVSFHSTDRFDGDDYAKEWDGARASEDRILRFCDAVLSGAAVDREATAAV